MEAQEQHLIAQVKGLFFFSFKTDGIKIPEIYFVHALEIAKEAYVVRHKWICL